jgi:hypothetical protein
LFDGIEVIVLSDDIHPVGFGNGRNPEVVDLGRSTLIRQAYS